VAMRPVAELAEEDGVADIAAKGRSTAREAAILSALKQQAGGESGAGGRGGWVCKCSRGPSRAA